MKKYNNGKYGDVNHDIWCPLCKTITTATEWLDVKGGYLQGIICDHCGKNLQQKKPSYYGLHVYKQKCKCGKEHIALTQDDSNPEYYSSVGIICSCGEAVFFELPVN